MKRWSIIILDFFLICSFAFLVLIITTGGFSVSLLGSNIQMHKTQNPTIIFSILFIARLILSGQNWRDIQFIRFLNIIANVLKARFKKYSPLVILGILIGGYIVIMSITTITRHLSFNSGAFDLGIFDQVIWNTLHGSPLYSSILGNRHFFGEHFSPILLLISPLYLIYEHPITLLIFQTIALASGAIPLYLLAKKKLENSSLALLFSLMYLCYQPMRNVNLFDFHEIAIVTPLFLFAFFYLDQRKYAMFGLFLMLAVLCKEEVTTIVFIFGIYVAHIQKQKKLGYSLACIGILLFIVEIGFIIPHYRQGAFGFVDRYTYLGQNIPQIFYTLLLRPIYVLKHTLTSKKIMYIIDTFEPLGFLSILSPSHLLLTLPTLLQNLLSDYKPQYTIGYQYTAPLTPFVFISAIHGLKNLYTNGRIQKYLKIEMRKVHIRYVIFVGLLLCMLFLGKSPIYNLRQYRITDHTGTIQKLMQVIPKMAVVSAQELFVPHLSHRKYIYIFPTIHDAEYIFLDTSTVTWGMSKEEYCQTVFNLLQGTYGVIAMEKNVFVLKKGYSSAISQAYIFSEFCRQCQISDCQS